jgi:hypothetical protein
MIRALQRASDRLAYKALGGTAVGACVAEGRCRCSYNACNSCPSSSGGVGLGPCAVYYSCNGACNVNNCTGC